MSNLEVTETKRKEILRGDIIFWCCRPVYYKALIP